MIGLPPVWATHTASGRNTSSSISGMSRLAKASPRITCQATTSDLRPMSQPARVEKRGSRFEEVAADRFFLDPLQVDQRPLTIRTVTQQGVGPRRQFVTGNCRERRPHGRRPVTRTAASFVFPTVGRDVHERRPKILAQPRLQSVKDMAEMEEHSLARAWIRFRAVPFVTETAWHTFEDPDQPAASRYLPLQAVCRQDAGTQITKRIG